MNAQKLVMTTTTLIGGAVGLFDWRRQIAVWNRPGRRRNRDAVFLAV
jgi:hypothetical protein